MSEAAMPDVSKNDARVFVPLAIAAALSILLIVCMNPDAIGSARYITLGILIGSLYSNTTLAGVFSALGPSAVPFHLFWIRVLVSAVWNGCLIIALTLNIAFFGGPSHAPLMIGSCLFGQWILIAGSLGFFAKSHHLQIAQVVPTSAAVGAESNGEYQFKIMQLLVLTTAAAVVFAVGRIVMPVVVSSGREWPIFVFLAVAQIIMTLPLFLAALLRKYALVGLAIAGAQLSFGTYFEAKMINSLIGGGGPRLNDFIAINIASAILMLAFAIILRFHNYTLILRIRTSGEQEKRAELESEGSSADSIFT